MRARYVARKLGWAAVTLLFVLCFNFFLFRIMPGDPAGLLARSQRLTETEIAEQRAIFGLDKPLMSAVLDLPARDVHREPRVRRT